MTSAQVIHGECIEVMRGMEPDSVDAIVTDPPYDLTNRTVDVKRCESCGTGLNAMNNSDAPCRKCGGVLSYQRSTQRRGFMGKEWDGTGIAFRPEIWEEALRVARPGAYLLAAGSPRTYHRLACAIEDAGWVLIDCIQHIHGQGFPKGKGQLKPGYEPWTLARKPASRVLPLQIDACRIEHGPDVDLEARQRQQAGEDNGWRLARTMKGTDIPMYKPSGRWPANIILDENAARELDEMTGNLSSCGGPKTSTHDSGMFGIGQPGTVYSDQGGPSRFFYCPKSSRSERGEGNTHPTVKPVALMQWLVRLITPPGGILLDPFAGSGTTLLAADREGFDCIGIEREAAYLEIIYARLAATGSAQLPLIETG